MPSRLIECENNKRCDGVWTFGDNGGKAQWSNGARAELSIEQYGPEKIVIRRDDTSNPGFTALYIGKLSGSKFSGTVTWSWPGHWSDNVSGVWSATVDTANEETVPPPPAAEPAPAAPRTIAKKPKPKVVATVPTKTAAAVDGAAVPTSAAAFEAHFRKIWSSDQCVQQRGQSWNDYESWIVKFYSGSDGWNANASAVTARISNAAVRAQRNAELNALSIRVAGEWAKDNSCRKIRTSTGFFNSGEAGKPALSDFRDELEAAASTDTGDGARIGEAIHSIEREVDAALGQ